MKSLQTKQLYSGVLHRHQYGGQYAEARLRDGPLSRAIRGAKGRRKVVITLPDRPFDINAESK